MNEAHASEVAAIEAMTVEICGCEPAVPTVYGRSPGQAWLDEVRAIVLPLALKHMHDSVVHGSAWASFGTAVHENDWFMEYGVSEPPLPRASEPQRVMGRPRKVAPKPGRKFSGMTRFSWRQR